MTKVQNVESGERLSFYKLFDSKKYKIEIPIIQRDYAQGRQSNSEIRDTFLDALKKYLLDLSPNRDLDFIYGSLLNSEDNGSARFVPLDGQQRLTTLFLLHWYLAIKENKLEIFRNVFAESAGKDIWKSKFSYETRTSAREFCDALVSADINIKSLFLLSDISNNSLSGTIKNQQWYFLSWKKDPTIQGMLLMLDSIHSKFINEKNEFYELLTDTNEPIITFQFLKLEEFGLTDDLYIKMNARGKPLTAFENFKAKFEQQLKQPEFEIRKYTFDIANTQKVLSVQEYFSYKIDTEWANLFWSYAKNDLFDPNGEKRTEIVVPYDEIIMNLLKVLAINHVAGMADTGSKIRELIKTSSNKLTFNQFTRYQCFDAVSVSNLITLLDVIQNHDKNAKTFIPGFYYFDENILESFLRDKFKTAAFPERIIFHAYCQYLIKWNNENDFIDVNGLKNWMRVIRNLVQNTAPYNNEREFMNSIKGINDIINYSNVIYDYLIKNGTINGFDSLQIQEEKLKAVLINKNKEWMNLIYKAEQHNYFDGQIGFLLRLCNIEKYYTEEQNCSWNTAIDKDYQQQFINYFEKVSKIFNEDGLNNEFSKDGNYLWERALLVHGDFLIREGRNQSFLVKSNRDISWKRFLKGDKSDSHSIILKNIFHALDAGNVKDSLEKIIGTYRGIEWQKAFIETPKLFQYLGSDRYVRFNSQHGYILLKGERMTGMHAELNSLKFFYDYLENKPISPFGNAGYESTTGAAVEDSPCAYLDEWVGNSYAIDIHFFEGEYEIRFFDKIGHAIDNSIIEILEMNGLKISNNYHDVSYIVTINKDNSVMKLLKTLCSKLSLNCSKG